MARLDPQLVDRAVAEATKRAANLDYFFDSLSSSEWIEPLRERKLFSEPPTQLVDEQGYVRAPAWSASRYLARIAASAPHEVLNTISSISSDNERVHEDFVDAGLAMPQEQARELAIAESAWLSSRDSIYYLLPQKLTELAVRMARFGEIDVVRAMVRALFTPTASANPSSGLKRPSSRFSAWEYDSLLQKVVDEIVPLAPARLLEELVALLGAALDIMRDRDENDAGFDALSRIWRPTIAGDGDRSREVEEALVSGLRDAALAARTGSLLGDEELLRVLTSRPEELLRRIAMYVLAHKPEPRIGVVRHLVVDPTAFAQGEPSVEYRLLLAESAASLPRVDLQALLDVVQDGPDLNDYRDRATRYGYGAPTEDQIREHVAWWKAARLKLLLPALDEEWTAAYRDLVADVGDVEIPTSGVVATFVGPTSPTPVAELADMPDRELLAFLREWRPGSSWAGPSVEGLARVIGELAQQDPDRITTILAGFQALRPSYLEHALRGLEAALREDRCFVWDPIIDCLLWVVAQRDSGESHDDDDGSGGRGWMLARRQAASLLESGLLRQDDCKPPVGRRDHIWQIISAVSTDEDPTPAHEEQYGGSNMDPVTLSLNTTRPRGVRAAVAYAVWLHRVTGSGANESVTTEALTVDAPEVGDLLEAILDRDPSSSVRAAIAQHYTSLYAIDPEWARRHGEAVFPEADTALREAAWGSYIIYSVPYNDVLSGMRSVYERSAQLAGAAGHGFRWMNGDPRSRLGEHLMTFYWRGAVDLDDPLLTTFWDQAPVQTRSDALGFVGRSVAELNDIEASQAERLMSLWAFARENASPAPAAELGAFAWWFPATTLPVDWRLDQLLALVGDGIRPKPDFLVAQALPAMTTDDPVSTVRALRGLLELQRGSWRIDARREDIARVLTAALLNPESRELAEDTVHWLGALGYRDYRKLLP